MPIYCIDKNDKYEVHKMPCSTFSKDRTLIEIEAITDLEAIARARNLFPEARGCVKCMREYHIL